MLSSPKVVKILALVPLAVLTAAAQTELVSLKPRKGGARNLDGDRAGTVHAGDRRPTLHDREIDFDLIQQTGMDRGLDEDRVGAFGAKAVDSFLTTIGGLVVLQR
jgi:hypothetical protein